MNHQPFERWLLDEQSLETAQKRELDAHLRTCPQCTALVETAAQLRLVRAAEPASGFTQRFVHRLSAHRVAERRRRFWGMLVFASGGLGLLSWLGSPIWTVLINSPAESIARILNYIFVAASSIQSLAEVGLALLRVAPGFVPPFAWMVVASGLAGMALLWIVSIWRLTYGPRGA